MNNKEEEGYGNGVTFSTISEDVNSEFKKNGNRNIFEEVVDQFTLDKFTNDKGIYDYIKSLPLEDKRLSILSLLGEDNDIYNKIYNSIKSNNVSKLDHLKDTLRLIRDFIKFGTVERKKFGEIMTPIKELALPMVELVDKYDEEFWKNPNHKVLDSSAGLGTFLILCAGKFMNGLKEFEPDIEKRFKYIVENCLYYGELQSRNVFLWLCLIDPNDEYLTNTYFGSFLDDDFDKHMKDVWKLDNFNLIIQNPPYQSSTSGGNGARDLWDKFVYKSTDLLKSDGHMIFVHPSKWRSPEHKCLKMFKKYNLKFLEIHSDSDGSKVFGANTRYDFYCLQKSEYEGVTKIVDELGEEHNINIMKWEWIPNYNFKLISRIISDENVLNVIYSRGMYGNDKKWMSKEKTEKNNLPCVYGMYKDYTCSYRYSSEDKGHFGISKVILGLGRYLYPLIDINGEFGIMNNAFALPITSLEEGINIKNAIESEKFKEIIKSTKWSNFQVNWKMFKSFKKDFWKEFI